MKSVCRTEEREIVLVLCGRKIDYNADGSVNTVPSVLQQALLTDARLENESVFLPSAEIDPTEVLQWIESNHIK